MLIVGWFKVVHDRESKRKERRGKEGSEKEKKGRSSLWRRRFSCFPLSLMRCTYHVGAVRE